MEKLQNTQPEKIAIYVHWPYCLSKCPYCDFFSKVDKRVNQDEMIGAYLDDLRFYHNLTADKQVQSIFFGGGTPSLIAPQNIEKIIDCVSALWRCQDKVEISLEANPNTNHKNLFADLKKAGINRLSLGVQALNDQDLKFLGRTHNLAQALQAIDEVVSVFDNHSVDLIYARPNQELDQWQRELEQVTSLGLKHISLYQLTIEEGTVFARKGIESLEEEKAAQMYAFTQQFLSEKGYLQYEISNFSQEGYQSIHNLAYWRGEDYVGIGPSAHGRLHLGNKILATTYHLQQEELSPKERAEELIIMGLRIVEGIDKKRFYRQCGLKFDNFVNQKALRDLVEQGYLQNNDLCVRATKKGFLVLDKLIEELCS